MQERKQILILNNEGKGGLINHPAQFGYPEKKMVGEKWYFNTGRFSTVNGDRAAIFTENNFPLNIEDYADPKAEVAESNETETLAVTDLNRVLERIVGVYGEDSAEYQGALTEIAEWHNRHLSVQVNIPK